jgi:hypothetical protein
MIAVTILHPRRHLALALPNEFFGDPPFLLGFPAEHLLARCFSALRGIDGVLSGPSRVCW